MLKLSQMLIGPNREQILTYRADLLPINRLPGHLPIVQKQALRFHIKLLHSAINPGGENIRPARRDCHSPNIVIMHFAIVIMQSKPGAPNAPLL
jgi:hypothetical protein